MIRHWTVFAIGLVAILAGFAYALWCGVASDAPRGGVIAVALTFLMLFLDHPTAQRLLQAKSSSNPPADCTAVHNALAALLDQQHKAKWPLAATSVLGTLVAGFGDIAARLLGAP